MAKKLLTALFLLFFIAAHSQVKRYTVTGKIVDAEKQSLTGASVVLLNPSDSLMIGFGGSDNEGVFNIKNIKPQSVRFQITYIGYGTIEKLLEITGDNQTIDLGVITLLSDDNLLKEVVVKGEYVPIQIKKDTVEYNADAFRVRPNATVEELLKKLPGIEVDANGTITAQGEQVNRVTVDGKKFFGNDPKMATQNLPADAVKKVQVIDKKSEKAEFSGITDGETEKIINLQLKDNKKVGTFGDVAGGYGTQDLFESKISLNKFNSKYQLSALSNFNNLSNQGFNFSDYNALMGGNAFGGGGGGGNFNVPSVVSLGNNNQGRIKSATVGVNIYNEFSPRYNISTSYFFTDSKQDLLKDKTRENFNPQGNITSAENSQSFTKRNGHNINLNFQAKPDSFHRIDIESSLRLNSSNVKSSSLSTISRSSRSENSNSQKDTSIADLKDISIRGVFNKRMRKPGRLYSFEGSYGTTENDQDYNVESYITTPQSSILDSLIQNQISLSDNRNYRFYTEYREPLGKSNYIGLAYSIKNYKSNQDKNFYDIDLLNNSSTLNEFLSNFFRNDINYNRASLLYTKDNEKYAINADLVYQRSFLKGTNNQIGEQVIENSYNYFLPAFTFNWIDKNLRFRYNTNINEPTATQLQPIVDNSNPQSIYIGNPKLKPEYIHAFNVRYNFFDNFNFVNFFAFINVRYTRDKIVTAQNFRPDLVKETAPINTSSYSNISLNMTYSSPLRPLKLKTRIYTTANLIKGINFINGVQNDVVTLSPKVGIELENLKNTVVSLLGGYDIAYSQNNYSKTTSSNSSFTTQTLRSTLLVNFGKGITLDGDISHTIYSKAQFGNQNTLTLANAGISKLLFNDRITIKMRVGDIFNIGQGISRSASETYLEELTTNAIGRYGMLSMSYRLSAFAPANNNSQQPPRMFFR